MLDRRSFNRAELRFSLYITMNGKEVRCHARNISAVGASLIIPKSDCTLDDEALLATELFLDFEKTGDPMLARVLRVEYESDVVILGVEFVSRT